MNNFTAICIRITSFIIYLLTALLLLSCANPLNRATYERNMEQGYRAEKDGDWGVAEIAFYRAAENVRFGNLGDQKESEALFNLGRTKRIVGKVDESVDLLERCLELDEKLYGHDHEMIGYTIAELAASYFEKHNFEKGIPLLIRLEAMADKYSGRPRAFIKQLFNKYSAELTKPGMDSEAKRFQDKAIV